jgi:hypothetical protein
MLVSAILLPFITVHPVGVRLPLSMLPFVTSSEPVVLGVLITQPLETDQVEPMNPGTIPLLYLLKSKVNDFGALLLNNKKFFIITSYIKLL